LHFQILSGCRVHGLHTDSFSFSFASVLFRSCVNPRSGQLTMQAAVSSIAPPSSALGYSSTKHPARRRMQLCPGVQTSKKQFLGRRLNCLHARIRKENRTMFRVKKCPCSSAILMPPMSKARSRIVPRRRGPSSVRH
jgi:hypothetical protein